MLNAIIANAEAANVIPGQPWMYGVFALIALLGSLYVVTLFNPNR